LYRNIQCDNPTKLGSKWPIGFREEEVPSGPLVSEKKRFQRKKRNKDTMYFYTFMGILFLLCTSDQRKKNPTINSLEDHPMNISVKLVQIGPMVSGKNIIQL
jgi:hypothetical protein